MQALAVLPMFCQSYAGVSLAMHNRLLENILPRVLAGFALLALLYAIPARAQNCVAGLTPIDDASLGYQERENRCEGLLSQPFSSTGLRVVGFRWGAVAFNPADRELFISSEVEGDKQITVSSTKNGVYYRMDARTQDRVFRYPLDILRSQEVSLTGSEVATIVCVVNCSGLSPELTLARVYGSATNPPSKVLLTLRSAVDITSLRVTVIDKESRVVVVDADFASSGTISAGRPIQILLDPEKIGSGTAHLKAVGVGRSNDYLDVVTATLHFGERAK